MIINVNNPTTRYGYKKPIELFCSLMYLDYGIHSGLCDKDKYLSSLFVEDYPFNRNNLKEMGDIAIIFKEKSESLIDYSDISNLFYNTGRLILTGIVQSFMDEVFGDNGCGDKSEYDSEISGLTIGLIDNCGTIAYQKFQQLLKDFAVDKIDLSLTPVINVVPYFNDGIKGVNHAEILPIINTALFYSTIGSFMSILNTQQIKELFDYSENIENVSSTGIIDHMINVYKIEKEKLYNLLQFCSIYNCITTYIEKSVGIKFNDRFSTIFRAIGLEFFNIYNTQMNITEETNLKDIVVNESISLQDRMFALVREVINPISSLYVGDHHYDHRKMYMKYLVTVGEFINYYPPMVELLKYKVNVDYSNIKSYTSVLDAHAYDRMIKELLINYNKIYDVTSNISDKDYIISWYKLRYLERLVCEIYHYWKNSKSPFKIEGVDPIFVDVENKLGSTEKKMVEITSAPYSLAYERAMYIIDSINARYVEAQDFYYCDKWKRGINTIFNSKYYSKMNELDLNDFSYDNAIDAVRENQYGKYPYIVSTGLYNKPDLEVLASSDNIDFDKINKLSILDSVYVDSKRSISRSPYEIMKNNCFNYSILDNESGEELSKQLVDILKTLTNQEFLYLSIR